MLHFLNSCPTVCNICLPGFLLCCISTPWALESSRSSLAAVKSAATEGNGVGCSGVAFYPGMTWKEFYGAGQSDGVEQRKQKAWTPILDDTKLSSADTSEGRDALQGDLDRLEMWASVNLMKLSKAKDKILCLDQGNPRHAGQVMSVLWAVLKRRTQGCWWVKNWTWAGHVCFQPRRPTASWATLKEVWPAGQGRLFPSLLHSHETPPEVLCSALQSPL